MSNSKDNIISDSRGQASINGTITWLVGVVMGLIMLSAFLPVINDVTSTILAGNMSSFSNVAVIQMLVGLTGLLVIIVFFANILTSGTSSQPKL